MYTKTRSKYMRNEGASAIKEECQQGCRTVLPGGENVRVQIMMHISTYHVVAILETSRIRIY